MTAVTLVLALAAAGLQSPEWPQFRGPAASGLSREPRLPDRWSKAENVAWSAEVPGRGWSSPVVAGGRVFVTSAISPGPFKEPTPGIYGNDYIAELRAQGLSDEEVMRRVRARDNEAPDEVASEVRWMLYAFDVATGKRLFEREVHRGKPVGGRHRKNTYASETPATDGERVFVYVGNVGVFAFDTEGRPLWSFPLAPKAIYLDFGTASSPVAADGRVYVLNDNEEESYLLALDAKTGREAWRAPRVFPGRLIMRSSFTTPFVWRNTVRTEIVALGPKTVVSYGLDGRELWRYQGMSAVAAPTPVGTPGLLVVGAGSPSESVRPLVAFRPGASGDISLTGGEKANAHVAWTQERGGPYITSPLVHGSRVYVLYDKGFFGAFDLATGRELYKVRFPDGTPTFSSSPWAHGERLFALSEEGETFVIEAGDTFKVVGRNALGEMALATPALAHESVFLRTATRLYRIRG
jgi:outer membrane protein assembly factor BamB